MTSRTAAVVSARSVALEALRRIDEGAFANAVLPPLLDASGLDRRDRAFATELAYGTTRMRRACDYLVDRLVHRSLEPEVRDVLRLGAYQLAFLGTPPHASVSATVDLAPDRARGFVNAVLRRLSAEPAPPWPDPPTRLSYPDWVVRKLAADLGPAAAEAALVQMNEAPAVTERADGYVQDEASQWVAAYVGAEAGERVADLCAAPGGKATALARAGAFVVAGDLSPTRSAVVAANARRLGAGNLAVVVADGTAPPLPPASVDRVLVDAPCTGLGVLRRRPDARWRVRPGDIDRLAALQRSLLDAAVPLLRPGGTLVYSVCTLTLEETAQVDLWLSAAHTSLVPLPPPGPPWEPLGRGARLLPQSAGTDGMFVLGLRAPA
ncbi:MAG TPA: transcription antitermination factor NusB [Acidimicrobiales bacterium]|nr:transcription antitermination factor NusB [Acidimicrobiales bacterium]